jgi:hypothetical protein
MSLSRQIHSLANSTAILRAAALLVPRSHRKEWLQEWRSELWHVAQKYTSESPTYRPAEITAFALGAFQDALWMRRENSIAATRRLFQLGSPSRCELLLAIFAAAAFVIALALPGVHKVIGPSPYRNQNDLVAISKGGYDGEQSPTIRLGDYRAWSQNPHHLFTALAYYQPITRRVHTTQHKSIELHIARASNNLFELLNIPIDRDTNRPISSPATYITPREQEPDAVLSRSAWSKYFQSNPRIIGKSLIVAGRQATIIGIIPDESWPLSSQPDLWLLENQESLASLPAFTRGFVIARAEPSAFPSGPGGHRQLTIYRGGDTYEAFDCESLAVQSARPFSIFLFALALACLALPATTPLALGEYPHQPTRLPWATRVRRWAFLATKLAWISAIVYCVSLDAAYGNAAIGLAASQYIQLATTFFFSLFAFRWALCDQRKRCPVCLRSLTNPARVGQSSCNFLAWNGTELICLGGHGLLHVPDIPTSWFSTQRWLYLDPSWSSLFSAGYI